VSALCKRRHPIVTTDTLFFLSSFFLFHFPTEIYVRCALLLKQARSRNDVSSRSNILFWNLPMR